MLTMVVVVASHRLNGSFYLSTNNTHSQHLRYNIRKLNDPEIESQYSVEVQNRFCLLSNEEASDWDTFRNAVTGAASTCLGYDVQPKKEWITDMVSGN